MSLTVEKCLQAWTNSLKQMNAKADMVFFGDSLTYYGDFSLAFPDKVVCNLGLRGDTIQGMIVRVEQVKMLEPKVVYLMAGINDVANCSLDEFKKNHTELLRCLKDSIPESELICQTILPVNDVDFSISCNNSQIIACNTELFSLVKIYNLGCIDLYSVYEREGKLPIEMTVDGIHLKRKAYKNWVVELNKYKLWKDAF